MKTITQIANINLHYARESQHPYGTIGRPRSFDIEDDFNDKIIACFEEVFEACPLGKPKVITCAGIYNYRHKNPRSHHRSGEAFDFDAAFWDDFTLITKRYHSYKELYLGIECFMRIHFGIVLNYYYNEDHEDHWHIDNSVPVDFRTSYKSSNYHLQMVLSEIFEYDLIIDGIWGPQTEEMTKDLLNRLGLDGRITTPSTYKAFLRKAGKIAFLKFEQAKSPLHLLDNVYQIIADLRLDFNKASSITEALNDFRNHKETEFWLKEDSNVVENLLEKLVDEVV